MAEHPLCDIEVGEHPGPFWKEMTTHQKVCSGHRNQLEMMYGMRGFVWGLQFDNETVEKMEDWRKAPSKPMLKLPNHVEIHEINEQREKGWVDFHPEDFCHRCGMRNIVWCTDSDRFNLALGAHGVDKEWQGIICVACFDELHKEKTGLKTVWKLIPEVMNGI